METFQIKPATTPACQPASCSTAGCTEAVLRNTALPDHFHVYCELCSAFLPEICACCGATLPSGLAKKYGSDIAWGGGYCRSCSRHTAGERVFRERILLADNREIDRLTNELGATLGWISVAPKTDLVSALPIADQCIAPPVVELGNAGSNASPRKKKAYWNQIFRVFAAVTR